MQDRTRLPIECGFIEYASRPDVMARQSQYISYGPTTYAAGELINPDIAQHLPTAPQNTGNAYWVDTVWWGDHVEEEAQLTVSILGVGWANRRAGEEPALGESAR